MEPLKAGDPPRTVQTINSIPVGEDIIVKKLLKKYWPLDKEAPLEYVSYNIEKANIKKNGGTTTFINIKVEQRYLNALSQALKDVQDIDEDWRPAGYYQAKQKIETQTQPL